MLVEPPPELEPDPDVLWQLTRTWYGIKTSPKLWQQYVASKLEELGLKKNTVDPSILTSEQLLVMHQFGELLIVGDKLQQESFIRQLSASVSLHDITLACCQDSIAFFLNKTVEWNQQEHSISLHLPASYYMKLLKMYDMTQAPAISALDDQLCHTGRSRHTTTLNGTRQKLYRTAVGQLLWATPVRPDLSFAVTELSKSLQAPTSQDEQQLKKVLRYIKGTLHFTISLQPPRKRVIERASSIQLQASFDSTLEGSPQPKKSTSGATLSLWGVPLATSSRSQALHTSSIAEAELYAMRMATQDALHLQSSLQEMQLSQLAKPFELTVCTDSSSGKALASKLDLTKQSKHVQLSYWFMKPLGADGQLTLAQGFSRQESCCYVDQTPPSFDPSQDTSKAWSANKSC